MFGIPVGLASEHVAIGAQEFGTDLSGSLNFGHEHPIVLRDDGTASRVSHTSCVAQFGDCLGDFQCELLALGVCFWCVL